MPSTVPRHLLRYGSLLLLLLALYSYLQAAVPTWAATYVAREMEKTFHGPTHVQVEAYPFWKLLSGRFDRLQLDGSRWHGDGQEFERVHLLWLNGSIDMGELTVGVLRIRHEGTLQASVTFSKTFLLQRIPVSLLPYRPHVDIRPDGITLRAQADYAGLAIPLVLRGTLVPVAGGEALAFQPTALAAAGVTLPLPKTEILLHTESLPLPPGLHLRIAAVRLGHGSITLTLVD